MIRAPSARPLLAPLVVATLLGAVACTSGWEGEAESPHPSWDDVPPGQSTAVAPPQSAALPPAPSAAGYASSSPWMAQTEAEDADYTAVATFQPVLDPYGTWYDDPVYGTVWSPSPTVVGTGFSPYLTAGHWQYTADGYYWASDYDWGWATFHYGRWVWVDARGWVWIPGTRWAPAWVEWRYGGGYIGWGPAHPRWCYRGTSVVWITVGASPYVFAPSTSFFHPHPSSVVVAGPNLVASTTPYTPPPLVPASPSVGANPVVGASPIPSGKPYVGAKPFLGPDPKLAGIPAAHLPKTAPKAPVAGRPEHVAWAPHPASKMVPPNAATAPGYASPSAGVGPKPGVPWSNGSKGGSLPPPTYAQKPMPPGASVPKPYDKPVASAPKYNGPAIVPKSSWGTPKPYSPPVYSGPPAYKPPVYGPSYPSSPSYPSYGGAAPKPVVPPAYGPKPYSPPSWSAAPKPYSPPPSFGGGGGYAPKPYSPPPSFGGGGGYAPKPFSPPPSFGGGGGYSPPPSFGGGGGYAPKPFSPPPSFGGGGGGGYAPKPFSPPPSFGGGGGGGFGPKPSPVSPGAVVKPFK